MDKLIRVQCFVDGFNLYHANNNFRQPHLKWLNLRALLSSFTDPNRSVITDIFYFSAFANFLPEATSRHKAYVKALRSVEVTPILGRFKEKDAFCKNCKTQYKTHEEKETDVNIALWLLNEAYRDNFDEAFVISRDSDLTPAIKMVIDNFNNKSVKVISPPNAGHSKEIAQIVGKKKLSSIKLIHLERSLFDERIYDSDGNLIVEAPERYKRPT